ncbi:hypothetical protein PBI_VIVALDI_56 [Mycobacterium phage Vivaldi]|uniref:Uncharacterized protein n=1 Tax=Mycobacterium phage Vivaldi TaxID=1536599 RepID=A0A088FQ29_9CAUD|nr:hypothetical protein PBI_VIVALDI_56 [Mycobacterium phage Vivaldi]
MTAVDLDTARQLVGDGVPSTGALPASWWISTDADLIEAYDGWSTLAKLMEEKAERIKAGAS